MVSMCFCIFLEFSHSIENSLLHVCTIGHKLYGKFLHSSLQISHDYGNQAEFGVCGGSLDVCNSITGRCLRESSLINIQASKSKDTGKLQIMPSVVEAKRDTDLFTMNNWGYLQWGVLSACKLCICRMNSCTFRGLRESFFSETGLLLLYKIRGLKFEDKSSHVLR